MLKVAVIAADRGAFVRTAPLLTELRTRADCRAEFIFAGDDYMVYASSELFRDLHLPYADSIVGASEGSRGARLAKVMSSCERLARGGGYGAIVLVGQSPTTLACALACARADAVLAHVEAGLRLPGLTGRTSMAAQIDRAADLLLAPSQPAHERLLDEGFAAESIVLTGSLACDAAASCLQRAWAGTAPVRAGLEPKQYALAVVETPAIIENVLDLRKLVSLFEQARAELPVAVVVHPRLRQRLTDWGLAETSEELPSFSWVQPRGYIEYLSLVDSARLILTDVGGVQDDATFLEVPCITLADATDRRATVESGNNTLVGLDVERALQAVQAVVTNEYPRSVAPAMWDGGAARRVVDALLQAMGKKASEPAG